MSKEESDIDFSSDEEETNNVLIGSKKKVSLEKDVFNKQDDEEDNAEEEEGEREDEQGSGSPEEDKISEEKPKEKVESTEEKTLRLKKKLEKMKNLKKQNHKTGVVYLSRIPPYMKPAKMRQILSKFGEIDRLFLKRENDQKHTRRIKGGGNKKAMYEEGWGEFIRKRDAKLCAMTLNGNIIGGKKGTFYHDDILNVKYLPGFKWADLTEQIARENDIRQSKLEMEISQANKLNAEFIRNVEQSKMLHNMKKSKKRNNDEQVEEETHLRDFKQRKVTSSRANAPKEQKQASDPAKKLGNVLSNLL
ncbi:hypothetical protein NCAS_0A05710 [Naumovozyma castellii]|uniref:Pre-rRNA-processing protein ESF2 n=1 Tax=Naumovozyma castellii TaxID=27288 RepID=G0V6N3_NAUCA|nr:hypothetical protein NCAS_0A05710 [Naumovozyma castellii CBS 4309]CCC67129.1 hypothetical protein NCAS_0A05710 [Naumovozyma castellii CBS 4309]